MKILDLYIHFTEREWKLLRGKYSETEIKKMLTKQLDIFTGKEAEKIESEEHAKRKVYEHSND